MKPLKKVDIKLYQPTGKSRSPSPATKGRDLLEDSNHVIRRLREIVQQKEREIQSVNLKLHETEKDLNKHIRFKDEIVKLQDIILQYKVKEKDLINEVKSLM